MTSMRDLEESGDWTKQKLECLQDYLKSYLTALSKQRQFTLTYVDGFAGTGKISRRKENTEQTSFFPQLSDPQRQDYLKGSTTKALELEPGFHKYLFVEVDSDRAKELQSLESQFPSKAGRITIRNEDANVYLRRWCSETDWKNNRAVVFLDPYSMQVDWGLIERIAKTQAIDMWLLFPYMALNRMLPKDKLPNEKWAKKISDICGTNEWIDYFYRPVVNETLFGRQEGHEKEACFERIVEFVIHRLETAAKFAGVVRQPLILRNSRGPLFFLCFAAGNVNGAPIAVRIAGHIIGRKRRGG